MNKDDIVGGQTLVTAIEGYAKFDDLVFISSPGSKNISFYLFSPSINTPYVKSVLGYLDNSNSINNLSISFDFRNCIRGEIVSQNECIECNYGTFSF